MGDFARAEYADLATALRNLSAGIDPSEAHGVLCGILSVNLSSDMSFWLKVAEIQFDVQDALAKEKAKSLNDVFQQARIQMQGDDLDFMMLLPDDDAEMEERVLSLGNWARGFLYGMAMAGFTQPNDLPEETKDFLLDLSEISNVALDVEDSEDDEEALMELEEYIRIGALLVSETLQPMQPSNRLH